MFRKLTPRPASPEGDRGFSVPLLGATTILQVPSASVLFLLAHYHYHCSNCCISLPSFKLPPLFCFLPCHNAILSRTPRFPLNRPTNPGLRNDRSESVCALPVSFSTFPPQFPHLYSALSPPPHLSINAPSVGSQLQRWPLGPQARTGVRSRGGGASCPSQTSGNTYPAAGQPGPCPAWGGRGAPAKAVPPPAGANPGPGTAGDLPRGGVGHTPTM